MKQKTKVYKGRDAVVITVIWGVAFLVTSYLLDKSITSADLVMMFVGLTVFLVFTPLLRNGW